jgi:hypothetical protein
VADPAGLSLIATLGDEFTGRLAESRPVCFCAPCDGIKTFVQTRLSYSVVLDRGV